MYLKENGTKAEIWLDATQVSLIRHPHPGVFDIYFKSWGRVTICFEGGLKDLVKELGLFDMVTNTGVKVMTSRDANMQAKYFIVRDATPKYFGDRGWTDVPFFFPSEDLAKATAAVL